MTKFVPLMLLYIVLLELGHEYVVCVAGAEFEVLGVGRLDVFDVGRFEVFEGGSVKEVGAKVAFGMIALQALDLGTADPSAYLR